MRTGLLVVAGLCLTAPLTGQDRTPDFMMPAEAPDDGLKAYTDQPYRPIRVGEARSAGFLTEGELLPFGESLGPTSPPHVRSAGSPAVTYLGSLFAVRPPTGGAYRVGDTLMIAIVVPGPHEDWGMSVVPSGLLEVISRDSRQTVTKVVAIYGPMRTGQVVLPMSAVTDPGETEPVATPAGPTGMVIGPRRPRELQMPGGQMYINLGRGDGIALGDFVQVRSLPGPQVNAADSIEELMATAQVIHVNGRSSTIRLINIVSPDIPFGTPVVRVATLP